MPLHPQAEAYLARLRNLKMPAIETLTAREARRYMPLAPRPLPEIEHVAAIDVESSNGTCAARLYRPHTVSHPSPLVIYLHGGGWVIGSLATHEGLCRHLARLGKCHVLSVGYRLAPEHPFPQAAEDAYAALSWAAAWAEQQAGAIGSLIMAGDSAGGNLATVACLMARDRNGPAVAGQLLIYPICDALPRTSSYESFADGYGLTRAGMQWFLHQYCPDPNDALHPYVSPLRAESLVGLPTTHILTAEYDPLRDEARQYADRLTAAGVPTTYSEYPGMIHGFVRRTDIFDDAQHALRELATAIERISS